MLKDSIRPSATQRDVQSCGVSKTLFVQRFAAAAITLVFAVAFAALGVSAQSINFESPTYTLGNINGQDGWSKTGPFDVAVVPTSVPGFGSQALRISNGITSGSFGDQTFSKSSVNEAGETGAQNGGFSGGIRQSHFEYQFSITSAVPGAQQPGLLISVAPDRGDGARMSYLRFEDQADGIHVFFDDYQDLAPFGVTNPDAAGCGAEDDFFETDIATLARNTPHTIRFVIDFVDGPRNDVVKIYINGVLRKVGTTWEDYFRYCSEQAPNNTTKTVDSMLFRAGGSSVPANLGNGFLIDGINATSGPQTTVKVTSANQNGWLFWNDETDTPDPTLAALGSMVAGPGTPPNGSGSAQISVSGTQRRNLASYQFAGTPLASISTMSYSTYNPSAGNGGSAARSAYLNFNVDFNGSDTWQRRLLFLPGDNGSVTQNNWKSWDTINGGAALWRYSGATWPAGIGGGGEPGSTTKTWTQVLSQYPGVRIRVTDAHVGLRVGEPYNDGYTENIDSFTFGTAAGTTVFDFEPLPLLVDDNLVQCPTAPYTSIQAAINAAGPGATITVCAGTYNEDLNVNKANLTLVGAGVDVSTIVGPMGGGNDTVSITASGIVLDGFTITRAGNAAGTWGTTENIQGILIAGSNVTIQNSKITGNRNGIYVGESYNNATIRRNIIDFNRTGIHIVDNNGATILENFITNNWTMGILYRSGGGSAPTQMTVRGNNISGNWFSDIEFREPAGVAALNMSGNYLGTTNPTRVVTEQMEPGYTSQIPVAYGGAAVPPASHPTVSGSESAFVDYSPFLNSGSDTQPGTPGFQGDFANLTVNSDSSQANGADGNIQEGINLATSGGTVTAKAGTYSGNVDIDKAVTLFGTPSFAGSLKTSAAGAAISPGNSPGIMNTGNLSLVSGSTLNIELNGTAVGTFYDQLNVTGTVNLGGATLNVIQGFTPAVSNTFTIVNNDSGDAVTGTFNGLAQGATFVVAGTTYQISYTGGDGNDVVLTATAVTCNDVSTPVMTSKTGIPVTIPVNTTDLSSRGVIAADFTFNYNPLVLDPTPANITVTPGTVTNGTTLININKATAGTVIVSVYTSTPFSGAGTLVDLHFNVIGAIGSSTPLTLNSFIYNGGLVCSNSTSGTLTIISGTVTGNVRYLNTANPAYPVPNVSLTAPGTPLVSGVTDVAGNYSLSGFGPGSYTVTPSKANMNFLTPNGIFSNDASLVSQHVVSLITLNATQVSAAKVSGLPALTSFDAALIAQWIVGIPNGLNQTGQWKFSPISTSLGVVNANAVHNYTALLMGDVNGDWVTGPTARPEPVDENSDGAKNAVRVSVPNTESARGSVVSVPFRLDNLKGQAVGSYQFDIEYDPSVLEPVANSAMVEGTISDGLAVLSNSPEPGLLKVAVYGALPVSGDGVYLNLRFSTIGTVGRSSALAIRGFRFNDGGAGYITSNGNVTVTEASNNAAVHGRLLSSAGQPVGNARVVLMSTTGARLSAVSTSFGYFDFSNLAVGETYTVNVLTKRYTFSPRTVSVTPGVTDLEMIADQ